MSLIFLGYELNDAQMGYIKAEVADLVSSNRGLSFESLVKSGDDIARAVEAFPQTSHLMSLRRLEHTDGPWLFESTIRILRQLKAPLEAVSL